MIDIYYTIWIFIFFLSLYTLFNFNKVYKVKEWQYKFKNITGEEPSLVDYRKRGDKKLYINHNYLLGVEILWTILGFFTFDKYIFLSIFTTGLIIDFLFKKNKFTLSYKIASFSFLLLRTSLYLLLIVNHFT